MSLPPISLCCISKGEPGLARALKSALPLVAEVVIVCDPADRKAVDAQVHVIRMDDAALEDRPITVVERPFDGFGQQRNASMAAASHPWRLWLDSDDELVGAGALAKWLEGRMGDPAQFLVEYRYAKNLVQPGRERLFYGPRGDWRDFEVHELWLPPEGRQLRTEQVPPDVCHVLHHYRADKEADGETRPARNRRLLEAHIRRRNAAGLPPDRRLLGHYITQLIVDGELDFADGLLRQFILDEPPGGPRGRAWRERSDIAMRRGQYDVARQFAMQALAEDPTAVESRLALIDACAGLEHWAEAWHWYEDTYHKGVCLHGDGLGFDPALLKPQWVLAAKILYELERFEQALRALLQVPEAERTDATMAFISRLEHELQNERAAEAFETISCLHEYDIFAHDRIDQDFRRRLAVLMPRGAQDYPAVAQWLLPAVPADRPSVAIHCGMECNGMYEAWGPDKLEAGLGGSEEAAIRLALELARAGCHVEMYGPWTREGLIDGVHYIYHAKWNKARRLDVFVAWRYEQLADLAPECRERWLWNHDLILPHMNVFPRRHGIDRMLCLSRYHAAATLEVLGPECPPILLTRNGLPTPETLVGALILGKAGLRQTKVPGRCIYASSPDRGLLQLLRLWPAVRREVPGAELHVYYGFTKGWMRAEERSRAKKAERLLLERLLAETEGVVFKGMVGKAELYRAFAEASVWAYPSTWYETSCITAMQAQALGARPVTTDLAALAETVEWGDVLPTMPHIWNEPEHAARYLEMLIAALALPDPTHDWRPELAHRWAWAGVAEQWRHWIEEVRNGRAPENAASDAPGSIRGGGQEAASLSSDAREGSDRLLPEATAAPAGLSVRHDSGAMESSDSGAGGTLSSVPATDAPAVRRS